MAKKSKEIDDRLKEAQLKLIKAEKEKFQAEKEFYLRKELPWYKSGKSWSGIVFILTLLGLLIATVYQPIFTAENRVLALENRMTQDSIKIKKSELKELKDRLIFDDEMIFIKEDMDSIFNYECYNLTSKRINEFPFSFFVFDDFISSENKDLSLGFYGEFTGNHIDIDIALLIIPEKFTSLNEIKDSSGLWKDDDLFRLYEKSNHFRQNLIQVGFPLHGPTHFQTSISLESISSLIKSVYYLEKTVSILFFLVQQDAAVYGEMCKSNPFLLMRVEKSKD